jgi:hypothetical protein
VEFNRSRQSKKSQAWLTVQRMLMANIDLLITAGVFPPDKFFQVCMEIDQSIAKTDTGSQEGSGLKLVEDFLNGQGAFAPALSVSEEVN